MSLIFDVLTYLILRDDTKNVDFCWQNLVNGRIGAEILRKKFNNLRFLLKVMLLNLYDIYCYLKICPLALTIYKKDMKSYKI